MILHLRRNAVAYLALFVALGGTSFAAVKLGKSTVTNRTIKPGAVTNSKIGKNAVTGGKVKNGSLSSADFKKGTLLKGATGAKGDRGDKGDKGDTGPATGAAGGDLKGNYPNPTIKPLGDWTDLSGLCRVDPMMGNIPWLPVAGADSLGFRVDRDGMAHLRGLVSCSKGTNTSVVTALPAGARPLQDQEFAVLERNGTTPVPGVYVKIDASDGEVVLTNYSNTFGVVLSLDGIEFDTLH